MIAKPSFRWAMITYAALALAAWFTLEGITRTVLLIFLAGLALKTLIAWKAGW